MKFTNALTLFAGLAMCMTNLVAAEELDFTVTVKESGVNGIEETTNEVQIEEAVKQGTIEAFEAAAGRRLSSEEKRRVLQQITVEINAADIGPRHPIPCDEGNVVKLIDALADAGKLPADPLECFEQSFSFFVIVITGAPLSISFVTDLAEIPPLVESSILAQLAVFIGIASDVGVELTGKVFEVEGDPHFKTWSGTWYDYHGACDMKMVHAPHFDGQNKALDVDIRTRIRYEYSYVESAVIKLGDDTLEMGSFGEYFLNGISGAKMPATFAGYPVTYSSPTEKVHKLEIALGGQSTIVLKAFKDMVAVQYHGVDSSRFHGALGMAGSFENGKLIGRDGVTEFEDVTAFANEWQIQKDEPMLFVTAQGPQHPQQCELPKISVGQKKRRLGESVAREKAERACAHFSGETFDNCVFDVMATGDLDIADAGVY